jgi:hypothetical protein
LNSTESIKALALNLLGRPLNHKPEQGIYIDNGQKVMAK